MLTDARSAGGPAAPFVNAALSLLLLTASSCAVLPFLDCRATAQSNPSVESVKAESLDEEVQAALASVGTTIQTVVSSTDIGGDTENFSKLIQVRSNLVDLIKKIRVESASLNQEIAKLQSEIEINEQKLKTSVSVVGSLVGFTERDFDRSIKQIQNSIDLASTNPPAQGGSSNVEQLTNAKEVLTELK